MEIALFIQNLQEERAEVALFIFTKQSDAHFNLTELRTNKRWTLTNKLFIVSFKFEILIFSMSIQERFSQTDRALEEVPTWPNVSQIIFKYIFNVVFCVLVGQDFDHDQIVESEHARS